MKRFLWAGSNEGRKLHWVSWNIVTTHKKDGGLGVSRLTDVNIALLMKWAWRFKIEKTNLWRKVVEAVHGGKARWSFLPVQSNIPGCWKALVTALTKTRIGGKRVDELIKGKMGNGQSIRFWKDVWYGSTALMNRWPGLYGMERNKNCFISDRLKLQGDVVSFYADWTSSMSTVETISEMQDVVYMQTQVTISNVEDRWTWGDDGSIPFSVALVKKMMREERNEYRDHVMKWESWVPLKVNILMWRLEMDRIPTRIALIRRNINIHDVSCLLCGVEDESSRHVFTGCEFSYGVWSGVGKWCKINPIFAFDIEDLMTLYKNVVGSKWAKKIIRGIVMITCWAIWKERNKKMFDGSIAKVVDVVAAVKSMSFLWLKSRSRFGSLLWKDWSVSPLYML